MIAYRAVIDVEETNGGTVRELLDEALASGWQPDEAAVKEIDGLLLPTRWPPGGPLVGILRVRSRFRVTGIRASVMFAVTARIPVRHQ